MNGIQALATVGIACFGVGFAGDGFIRVKPYSAVERVTLADGSMANFVSTLVRSDGSMVQKADSDAVVLWDVRERTETVADPITRTYVVAPLTKRRIPGMQFKNTNCERFFATGNPRRKITCSSTAERAFGYSLTKVEITTPGGFMGEVLHAIPELGWVAVRRQMLDHTGAPTLTSEVIELREGEPDPRLFDITRGYRALANFVEYRKVVAQSRNRLDELTLEELTQLENKWRNVVREAKADGDNRFK